LSHWTRDGWLEAHAYLQPVACFCALVDRAAAGIASPGAPVPCWDDYGGDFRDGVPLLQSTNAALDLEPAGRSIVSLVERIASQPLTGGLKEDAAALHAGLRREADAARRVVDWLLGDDVFVPASPGLLSHLGWTLLARYLHPVVEAFGRWRDDERWLRHYCPTCGSAPAMAQLAGTEPGRRRFLCCGRCGTRWQYKRTGCPFCEGDTQRLSVVAVQGEGGLRIDYCESCRGYLKTYDGEGNEALLLSDWTSLHLDLVAHDRGLKRLAASLYRLDAVSGLGPGGDPGAR
jgi:FdhE protein